MRFRKQIRHFLIIGILTVLIDYAVYTLSRKLMMNTTQSKAFGFVSGTVFSFFANRNITFRNQDNVWRDLYKFLFLYIVTLLINISINNYLMYFFLGFQYKIQLSFLFATLTSAFVNFMGMKYFVFKKAKAELVEKY
jgi:putative flippase GtrA